ncbi:MAG: hypothetical protein ONB06_02215 [candidate division KSB1 bacterium]|nr:hypothetical protein [candidate division KSB1 bacterium]
MEYYALLETAIAGALKDLVSAQDELSKNHLSKGLRPKVFTLLRGKVVITWPALDYEEGREGAPLWWGINYNGIIDDIRWDGILPRLVAATRGSARKALFLVRSMQEAAYWCKELSKKLESRK